MATGKPAANGSHTVLGLACGQTQHSRAWGRLIGQGQLHVWPCATRDMAPFTAIESETASQPTRQTNRQTVSRMPWTNEREVASRPLEAG